ncbi:MAG TPA: hypothetical protein VFA15_09305 [Nitrososphaera sp.]|nr:hypothetical protein [Nitrososphaera sp.]
MSRVKIPTASGGYLQIVGKHLDMTQVVQLLSTNESINRRFARRA